MIGYYKPYKGIFMADMLFATISATVALVIPLVVRYVTSTLIYKEPEMILREILYIAIFLLVLLGIDGYARYFIGNYGHVMGAKIEYNMRAEIFAHMQKLSFSFYDDAKVGQLMSRITTDLFDITELLHHGPENIILSLLKIIGALIILANINGWLTLAAFMILPIMFTFAFFLNKKMRRAFKKNRQKIAEINVQIEDILEVNLSFYRKLGISTGFINSWERLITDSEHFKDLLCQFDFNTPIGVEVNLDMKYIKEFFKICEDFIYSRTDI